MGLGCGVGDVGKALGADGWGRIVLDEGYDGFFWWVNQRFGVVGCELVDRNIWMSRWEGIGPLI